MSRELTKMNLIAIVQQLPEEDIHVIETYIKMIEQENQTLNDQLDRELIKRARLEDRINKAIEFIEKNIKFCENDSQGAYEKCNIRILSDKKLLKILKGEE